MAKLRTQDYECPVHGRESHIIQLDDGVESTTESCPEELPCTKCGQPSARRFSAPALMQRALPDGTNRGYLWDITKERSRIQSESFSLPPSARISHEKEMSKLDGTVPEGKGIKR